MVWPTSRFDRDMEEVDLDHNGIDHGGKGLPQRGVSVGRWEAEMGMAEIMVKKGKLWGSIGVIRNSALHCHVEEAVYMVEQGSLLLLRDDGTAISRQEVYKLLVVPSNGCSWDSYQIFCHLKRLGYIVGRHGTPWSTSRGKRPPKEAFPEVESEGDSECMKEIPDSANLNPESVDMRVDDHTTDHRSLVTVLEAVQIEISSDTVDCEDTDEEPLKLETTEEKHDETSSSRSDKSCVQENMQGLPILFSNLQLTEEHGDMALSTENEDGSLSLTFDVHHPNGRFKKTSPGFPAFSLCVVKGQEPPEQRQVRALEAKIGGRPLKFGTVDCGHVSIFSFTACNLPTLL